MKVFRQQFNDHLVCLSFGRGRSHAHTEMILVKLQHFVLARVRFYSYGDSHGGRSRKESRPEPERG